MRIISQLTFINYSHCLLSINYISLLLTNLLYSIMILSVGDEITKLKLIQVEDEVFKLCDENNEEIVSFDVEINKETALISYETKENYRHQGYASIGLSLLRDTTFQ